MTIVDTSDWGIIVVRGGDRVRFLQGLTTVNVPALATDRASWGAILNPKGRVLSIIAMEVKGDDLWLRCQPQLVDKTHQILERYAVMDDVTFELLSEASHRTWESPEQVWSAPFVPGAPAPASPALEVEIARIRGGFLGYGTDVDEACFPFETPLAAFLDYEKGCYVGQEPVFRVHSQGHTARTLRGFAISGAGPIEVGAVISHPSKERAGVITSAVQDSARERWLAMGYLHRTVWDATDGRQVTIAGRSAEVHEFPF
jgi:folate-binding protein YgfZ